MFHSLKQFLLTREPFVQAHMGHWIRTLAFRHYFAKEIPHHQIRRVLDAGCGDGSYAAEIARALPTAQVLGVDLLPSAEWEKHGLDNLSFQKGDLHELEETEAYDLIVSVDSLEHIEDNRRVMRAFWKALRPGGFLYLAMPRDDHGAFFLPARWFQAHEEWTDHEHIGEQYDLNGLKAVLADIGYSIELARHTFTVWGRLSWELENVLQGSRGAFIVRALSMPLFKGLGLMDLYAPVGNGHNLIIARKKP